jgi:hypothetical protein
MGKKVRADDINEIERRVVRAADSLLLHHGYLLEHDVNERSLTHHLANRLEGEFEGWGVDCEFNRNHDIVKRLNLPPRENIRADDLHATTVFPDIIVHRRSTDDNLVVIEVKKSTNPTPDTWDMRKLEAFQSQLRYMVAVFLRFRTGSADLAYEHQFVRRCQ